MAKPKQMDSGNTGYTLWGIGLLTAGLTSFYMFRLFFGIFDGTTGLDLS